MSGQLKWGVVHTEKFWREHAREVDADEFFILKQLIELLKSEDKSVVSIACYDLGEFVRFYPSGKTIVRHLGYVQHDVAMTSPLDKYLCCDCRRHHAETVSGQLANTQLELCLQRRIFYSCFIPCLVCWLVEI